MVQGIANADCNFNTKIMHSCDRGLVIPAILSALRNWSKITPAAQWLIPFLTTL
jgi:hypothetical protein